MHDKLRELNDTLKQLQATLTALSEEHKSGKDKRAAIKNSNLLEKTVELRQYFHNQQNSDDKLPILVIRITSIEQAVSKYYGDHTDQLPNDITKSDQKTGLFGTVGKKLGNTFASLNKHKTQPIQQAITDCLGFLNTHYSEMLSVSVTLPPSTPASFDLYDDAATSPYAKASEILSSASSNSSAAPTLPSGPLKRNYLGGNLSNTSSSSTHIYDRVYGTPPDSFAATYTAIAGGASSAKKTLSEEQVSTIKKMLITLGLALTNYLNQTTAASAGQDFTSLRFPITNIKSPIDEFNEKCKTLGRNPTDKEIKNFFDKFSPAVASSQVLILKQKIDDARLDKVMLETIQVFDKIFDLLQSNTDLYARANKADQPSQSSAALTYAQLDLPPNTLLDTNTNAPSLPDRLSTTSGLDRRVVPKISPRSPESLAGRISTSMPPHLRVLPPSPALPPRPSGTTSNAQQQQSKPS